MKLLILIAFCLAFVACIPRDRLIINVPNESGPARRPTIYRAALAVPEEFASEKEPIEKAGMGNSANTDSFRQWFRHPPLPLRRGHVKILKRLSLSLSAEL